MKGILANYFISVDYAPRHGKDYIDERERKDR
jgi:hypothetical protein